MLTDDRDLSKDNVMAVTNRDALAQFIANLGYNTDARQVLTADALGIAQSNLRNAAKHIERVSADGELQVFLFELTSVTLAHRRAITALFDNRPVDFLLVLTTPEYERIDFVLGDRLYKTPEDEDAKATERKTKRAIPMGITVERRKPSREALRTLRRMTFTCADDQGQLEKLLSAFRIAQWSEKRFNNWALFSDHYLTQRLPELPEWKDVDSLKAAYKAFRQRGDTNKTDQAKAVDLVVHPVLKLLGHQYQDATAADGGPMLRLSDSVVCFAYHWQRALDTKDDKDQTRPDDIPAVRVVTEFEKSKAQWAILTNGKQWRIYCARAHGRHANFYEVDFREMLADRPGEQGEQGDGESFRYFWLMLRAEAFKSGPAQDGRPGLSFLDRLFDGSREYAKALGERLKERVFETIFPHFAEGFIANMKAQDNSLDLTEERLSEVFRATLTLLYRLIFLLYAESRDLLPVTEANYFDEVSLRKLAKEIADRAGTNEEQSKEKLKAAFSPSETGLYDRLNKLFRVIDEGDSKVNVPLYNGGLFITKPRPDDDSDEGTVARFLAKYKVPDRHLALGLDRLARDEDDKRHELVPMDYKSLGVRHLGSIYEGLLEFKVRVAAERMAVVKGKKADEILTAREADKDDRKIIARSKMHGAEDGYLKKGSVYLENDKHERKATGSYYTPDYIVKYIVEHTVGPVLEEKFNELRDEFRKAEAAYHAAKRKDATLKKQGLADDPEKVANEYKSLVDRLFTLRVLDPAMGSGHFLVEAVDFITDRMLAFLSGFAWNPVQAFIQRTRRDILSALQQAEVTVDPTKLTEINLLKRHVLKRCIFGVDLNPMAVELAKVSLWLDCFTLGAPLSFLNHHLKPGNSLVGVTVDEVTKLIQLSAPMWGSKLMGALTKARDHLIRLATYADVTAAQSVESKRLYDDAQAELDPVRDAFDIYTSQWFGNGPVGIKGKAKRSKESVVAAVEYLVHAIDDVLAQRQHNDPKADSWFNEVPRLAADARRDHRFFHWELEFPEVFYAATSSSGQHIRRVEGAGFDAIVGNPPYINVKRGMEDFTKGFLEHRFELASGQWDQGVLFFERGLRILPTTSLASTRGHIGLICPKPFLLSESYEPLRRAMLSAGDILAGPCGECFDDAGVEGSICIIGAPSERTVRFVDGRVGEQFQDTSLATFDSISKAPFTMFSYMMPAPLYDRLYSQPARSNLVSLGEIVQWTRGAEMGKRDDCVLRSAQKGALPLLTGEDVEPFQTQARLWIKFDSSNPQKFKPLSLYQQSPKLLLRRVANTLIAAVDSTGAIALNTIYIAELPDGGCPYALCALLNAAPTRTIFAAVFNHDDTLFPYVRVSQLDRLLVPKRAVADPELSDIGRELIRTGPGHSSRQLLARCNEAVLAFYDLTRQDIGSPPLSSE